MSRNRFLLACFLLISLVMPHTVGRAAEPINLRIICRCVIGGPNHNRAVWLTTYILPSYQARMAEQGKEVTFELLQFSGTDEQLREQYGLELSAGEGADILGMDGFWIPEFSEAKLIQPLNQVVGKIVDEWEGWNHIPQGIQGLMSYKGERYGIPDGTDVRVIFYRIDIFERAGIQTPWQPRSWDEILETARRLQKAGVKIPLQINAGTAMGEATSMQGYYMLLLGTGHSLYDAEQSKWIVSSPGILDTLNFYKTVYIDEKLGDVQFQLSEDGRDRSFQAFSEGSVGMLVEGDYFWRSIVNPTGRFGMANRNDVVKWAMMPAQKPGSGFRDQDFVSISGGTGLTINPNTRYPQEAWAFLSYMTSNVSARANQLIEPRISMRDDVPVAGDTIMTAMGTKLLPLTTTRPLLPKYPVISNEVQLMTERVVSGEMTPQEAMAAYKAAVIKAVGEDNTLSIPLAEK